MYDYGTELKDVQRRTENTYEMEGSVMHKYQTKDERKKNKIALRKGGVGFLRKANNGNETGGAVPLAFRIEEYVTSRHNEVVASVEMDERERLEAVRKDQS